MNMDELEIKNAVIKSQSIRKDDGFLDCTLTLEYDNGEQCFGGYVLYLGKTSKHHSLLSVAGHWMWRCMEIAGVSDWKSIVGKTIRVRATREKIASIGHIIKDDWFTPSIDFKDVQ